MWVVGLAVSGAGEGPQCFHLHCHPSSQLGEVRDCVVHGGVLLSETSAPVMKLTSPHCLSLGLRDAQQMTEDERENPENTAEPVLLMIKAAFLFFLLCFAFFFFFSNGYFCVENESTYSKFHVTFEKPSNLWCYEQSLRQKWGLDSSENCIDLAVKWWFCLFCFNRQTRRNLCV